MVQTANQVWSSRVSRRPATAAIERKSGILLAEPDLNELYTYIRTGTDFASRSNPYPNSPARHEHRASRLRKTDL